MLVMTSKSCSFLPANAGHLGSMNLLLRTIKLWLSRVICPIPSSASFSLSTITKSSIFICHSKLMISCLYVHTISFIMQVLQTSRLFIKNRYKFTISCPIGCKIDPMSAQKHIILSYSNNITFTNIYLPIQNGILI